MDPNHLILYIVSFFCGSAGAFFMGRFGEKTGMIDTPNHRSSHQTQTPKGGGIGLLLGLIVSAQVNNLPLSFWGSATFLSLFSLWGDKYDIAPVVRLVFQFSAALFFLIGCLSFNQSLAVAVFKSLFFLVFIVGTANYYNFMDGINGIAAVSGIIGFALLSFYAYHINGGRHFIHPSISLSFCCLGFLPFNMPTARVFMGDVGSILLGFLFAGLVVLLSKTIVDFICLGACLFPFYADELTTMTVRVKNQERLFQAHRKHLYQLLANELAIPHWKVTLAYGFSQLIIGIGFFMLRPKGLLVVMTALAVCFVLFSVISFSIRNRL